MAIERKALGQSGKWWNHAPSRALAILGFALAAFATPGRAAFDTYQLPMFSSGTVTPNVMLLVDTSGSMDNIIWDEDFDPAVVYPDWGFNPSNGNYHIVSIDNDESCASGAGRRVVQSGKTLCLPNPAEGGDTRYTGNYLNYLFQTFTTGSNALPPIPNETRMQVARQVATDLVNTVTGVRFGVSEFYGPSGYSYGHGGTVLEVCDDSSASHLGNLTSDIGGMSADSNTPLAEAHYELTRYFRGLSSYYHSGTSYTSPVQYRCQDNYIIAITDGYPTRDTTFPSNDPADVADGTRSLPDWDNLAPATSQSTYPIFPQYSDGFQPESGFGEGSEGWSLYLDDIAKFGFDLDIFSTGTDAEGEPWGSLSDPPPDPDEPDFRQQNILTYTVGFATANQMLQDAADYGNGQFFVAKNAAELTAALQEAVLDIQTKASAAASVALNSTRFDTNDLLIYQARFNGADWSGDLKAIDVISGGMVGSEIWNAASRIPAFGSRTIVTQNSSTRAGVTAAWANLSSGQQNALKLVSDPLYCATCNPLWCTSGGGKSGKKCRLNCSLCNPGITGQGDLVLGYLRGDQSLEEQNGGDFRDRSVLLGDIVNSDPQFVGQQDFGYQLLPGSEGSSYLSFRASAAYTSRQPMVYVGANDGMLHGFQANKTGSGAGVERFAYIPLAVYPNLKLLSNPDYSHRFFVDGTAGFGDAYMDTGSGDAWHTVLVGSLGAGGRGVFALDVTDPASFGPGKVLWDMAVTGDTNVNVTDDADLGYTYGQPSVVRMANGKWAAVVGNGYNSTNHRAVLFILDLEDGSVMAKIDTGVGSASLPNGLSSPIPVDVDDDRITDAIYAGDMRGNLWKFDVSGGSAASWAVAFGGTPLFVATDPVGTPQPITARPEVTRHPVSGVVVLFGTGKYFEEVDRRATPPQQTQTFYGVYDDGAAVTGSRSALLQQSVIAEIPASDPDNPSAGTANPVDVRVTTLLSPSPAQKGWFLDLPTVGERQVSRPIVRDQRIIFTTVIPNDSACVLGGTSWLMEMDSVTGSRLPFSPFDLNDDQQFTAADYVEITVAGETILVPVSGKKSNEGVIKTPGIVGAGELEYKYTSGTTGVIEVTVEPGNTGSGRQSWRQLQ
ncbi:MAG: pilus assembly protein [Porticoccaceae bacterium]